MFISKVIYTLSLDCLSRTGSTVSLQSICCFLQERIFPRLLSTGRSPGQREQIKPIMTFAQSQIEMNRYLTRPSFCLMFLNIKKQRHTRHISGKWSLGFGMARKTHRHTDRQALVLYFVLYFPFSAFVGHERDGYIRHNNRQLCPSRKL